MCPKYTLLQVYAPCHTEWRSTVPLSAPVVQSGKEASIVEKDAKAIMLPPCHAAASMGVIFGWHAVILMLKSKGINNIVCCHKAGVSPLSSRLLEA